VSLGNAWTSDSGNMSDRKTATRGAWTTYAYGFDGDPFFGKSAQLIFHLRALDKERVPNPRRREVPQSGQSRRRRWFQVRQRDLNASLQASYQRLKLDGSTNTDKIRKLSIASEYKVADDVWLVGTMVERVEESTARQEFRYRRLPLRASSKPVLSPRNRSAAGCLLRSTSQKGLKEV